MGERERERKEIDNEERDRVRLCGKERACLLVSVCVRASLCDREREILQARVVLSDGGYADSSSEHFLCDHDKLFIVKTLRRLR